MDTVDDQQFCLRWNNFQANITSQFETLRDDEDFTDVTIACDGQRLQAHKVVLSACSPFFKELFKSNPCSHPIIFMRDVEAKHIMALMEFMYAGEVNVAQAHLSAFLKTAESLKIRGLTDTSGTESHFKNNEDTLYLNPQPNCGKTKQKLHISSTMTVTSSQDINESQPPSKRQCKADENNSKMTVNPFALQQTEELDLDKDDDVLEPKIELPDYSSEEEAIRDEPPDLADGVEIIPQNLKESTRETPPQGTTDSRKLHSLDPRPCEECGRVYSNLSNLRQHMKLIHFPTIVQCPICKKPFKTDLYLRRHFVNSHDTKDLTLTTNIISNNCLDNKYNLRSALRIRRRRASDQHWPYNSNSIEDAELFCDGGRRNRLIKLGEGIEIYEEQLRSVKWNDYRKLTRGLATILFSPAELASCSVTGQRWSRAGSGERPVKPALDRAKVQAIISYVATRFPMVEISRIKQVLAYKCKENSTAFKMKAVRYYGEQHSK